MSVNGPWFCLISCLLLSATSACSSFLLDYYCGRATGTLEFLEAQWLSVVNLWLYNKPQCGQAFADCVCVLELQRCTARGDLLWPGCGEGLHEGQCRSLWEEDQELFAAVQPEWKHVHPFSLRLPGLTYCTVCLLVTTKTKKAEQNKLRQSYG